MTAQTGDVVAFDFNRESHYIQCNPSRLGKVGARERFLLFRAHFDLFCFCQICLFVENGLPGAVCFTI